ncbi:MAG: alpha/beta hydrolase-fold protein [Myxococcota bacterium]
MSHRGHRFLTPLAAAALGLAACPDKTDVTGDILATSDTTADGADDTLEPEDAMETTDSGDSVDVATDADVGPEACRPSVPAGVTLDGDGRFREVLGLPPGDGLLPRGVRVYLPADFDASGATRYPVLYMHDGQNLFDPGATAFGEWGVDETIDDLTTRGVVPPTLVVAVDNTADRFGDYTPTVDPNDGGGNAEAYGTWLVDTLKPAIDGLFPTRCEREHTAVAGSSLGGLVSTYLGMRWPTVFGRVAAVSPSYWWDGEQLLRELEADGAPMPMRFWIDMGSGEGDTGPHDLDPGVAEARRAFHAALAAGLVLGKDVAYLEALGAPHNESAWRQRLGSILGFLLSDDGFASFPGDESLVLLPSGEGLYLEGRPHVLVVAEAHRGTGPRPARMTLPRSALRADGPVTFDSDGILTAVSVGSSTVTAELGDLTTSATLAIHPAGLAPVVFEAQLPETTPSGAIVYLMGDLAALGEWDPAAIALQPPHGGRATSHELALPTATTFQYQYTLGSAATVETTADGGPVGKRTGGPIAAAGAKITDLVRGWPTP